MNQPCPHCGATHALEARFCRICGAPLNNPTANSGPVSPLAQTAPLINDTRATGGLPGDDDQHISYDTSRVGLTEMEKMLRRPQAKAYADREASLDLSATIASTPPAEPMTVSPSQELSTPPAEISRTPVPATSRTKLGWLVAIPLVVCFAFAGALLAYFIKHRPASSTTAAIQIASVPVETSGNINAADQSNAAPVEAKNETALPDDSTVAVSEPTSGLPTPATRDKAEQTRDTQRNAVREHSINANAQHAPLSTSSSTNTNVVQTSPVSTTRTPPAPANAIANSATNEADAPYLRAVNAINGRDLKKLPQAELIIALIEFQKAARSGAHRDQAMKYADLLGKEFDRRKNWTK